MNNILRLLKDYNNNFILLNEITDLEKIEYLNFEKIILVTDENLPNISNIKKVINLFIEKYNIKIITLSPGEPNYEMIERTSKKIFEDRCDLVIALGGGSILDIVKAASMYENSSENIDDFSASRKRYSKKIVKTLAIPTTAGTGSEFTNTSVYKTRSNIKNWLWDELIFFDYVIYLPSLTLNLPLEITTSSGVDAFDHLIESLMSLKFEKNNLDFCNKGMETIWHSLPKLMGNSDNLEDRTNMLLGSGIAGQAIHFTGCGICHCIAHTLGSLTKVPHGVAVAYGLFHTIEPVLKYNQDLLMRFKGPFQSSSPISLAKKIQKWVSNLKINYNLIEKKINLGEFIKIYYLDVNKSMRDNTYYQPSKFDLQTLLQTLWD